jgi:hypothetical protein
MRRRGNSRQFKNFISPAFNSFTVAMSGMRAARMVAFGRETNARRNLRGHSQSGVQVEERQAVKQTALEPKESERNPAVGIAAVDRIIERIQESLCAKDMNPSVADLMRLLEIRRELRRQHPRPVVVRWIDECPQTPASGE